MAAVASWPRKAGRNPCQHQSLVRSGCMLSN